MALEELRVVLAYKADLKPRKKQTGKKKTASKKYRQANKAKLKKYAKQYAKKHKAQLKKRVKMAHHKVR